MQSVEPVLENAIKTLQKVVDVGGIGKKWTPTGWWFFFNQASQGMSRLAHNGRILKSQKVYFQLYHP